MTYARFLRPVLVAGFVALVVAILSASKVGAQCQSPCEDRHNSSNITGPRWPEEVKKEEGSRYPNAAHYWPFNATSSSKTLLDVRGKCKTLTYNGVRTTYAEQLGPVLSLDGIDDLIIISGIRSKCINDPTLCSKGLTVAFWLKYHGGEFILSGGRYTDHQSGPGFRFICLNCTSATDSNSQKTKHFVLDLSTQTQEWKITLDFLPKVWFHFSFTWHLDHGLKVYKNGKLVVKDTTAKMVKFPSLSPAYNIITLGRPNSISKLHKYGKFDIGHLVIWRYELSAYEVEVAFLTVLAKTTKSLICCHFKKGHPCLVNPCSDAASCRNIDEKYPCICPDIIERPCTDETPKYPCIDRSEDCAMFASQTGYCQYHKRYMMSMCTKSCKFCSSVEVTQRSVVHPEASPSFLVPHLVLTTGIGSRTVLLQPEVSKIQSQRVLTVSPTPTPYPTVLRPHFCDIGLSQSCICMNCQGNTNQGFACCTDVLDPAALNEGVMLTLTSISALDFLTKQPTLQKLLGEIVMEYCSQTLCIQNIHSKRLRRNPLRDDTGRNSGTKEPEQYIRSWDGSPIITSNTVRPYTPRNPPTENVLSTTRTTTTPPLTRPVDVKVVVFKIAPNAAQNKKLSTGLYVSITSLVGGTNRTYILKSDVLAKLIRRKRDVFKRKLNITIDSVTNWRTTASSGPRGDESATQSGVTPSLGASTIPDPISPNVEGQEGHNSTTNMSRGTFIIVLVTGIGGFVVLAVIIIYMLVKFLRRMKGEFVPDKVYPNEQKSSGGSDQLIPSFVDPSTPRITDVPKKTVRSAGSSGSAGGQGSGGAKKTKKPMGVKVTYKPPKWD